MRDCDLDAIDELCDEISEAKRRIAELEAEKQRLRSALDAVCASYLKITEAAIAVIASTYDQPSDGPEVRQPPSQESLDKLEALVIPLVEGR